MSSPACPHPQTVPAGPAGYLCEALAGRGSNLSEELSTLGALPRMCAARGLISYLPLHVLALPGPSGVAPAARGQADSPSQQPACAGLPVPDDRGSCQPASQTPAASADGPSQPLSRPATELGSPPGEQQGGVWSLLTKGALPLACQGLEGGSDAAHKYHALMLLSVGLQQACKAMQVRLWQAGTCA